MFLPHCTLPSPVEEEEWREGREEEEGGEEEEEEEGLEELSEGSCVVYVGVVILQKKSVSL